MKNLLVVLFFAAPAAAWACASCGCGNPVLTSMGTEPPLSGRVRLATSVRAWSETEGQSRLDTATLRELRFDLLASWSPSERWTVLAALPLQLRELTPSTLARERAFGLGDAEVQGRWVFLLDKRMRPRWVLGLAAGLRLPTAPVITDASGSPLTDDAQPGTGGFTALLGLSYSGYFGERFSAHAALQAELPFAGPPSRRAPFGGRLYGAGQYQPTAWLGLRAGVEARAQAASAAMAPGLTLFAAPELLVRLPADLTLLVGARLPFVDTRAGEGAGPMLLASLVVDL
ncbi:MAG: transporter [Archangiaceae bacterium]|nr:transporter [Archangiaceae bacterium]